MNIGKIALTILAYLLTLYILIPSTKENSLFTSNTYKTYILQDYNKMMFQNIHFQSTYRPAQSPSIAFNSVTYNSYSTQNTSSSYLYTGHITALNSQIKNIAPSYSNSSTNQSFSNKRNSIYTNKDYSKISNLNTLADVYKQESSKNSAEVSASENNLAVGFQNTNSTLFHASADNGGGNPEGEPLPLSNDIPVYCTLLIAYIAIKFYIKKTAKLV